MEFSTYNKVEQSFKVHGPTLLKFLKGFKLDQYVYLKFNENKLRAKNIDFKQCLGVIDSEMDIDGFFKDPLYVCVNTNELCKMLENMDKDLIIAYEPYNKVFKLSSDGKTSYTLKCQSNDKVRLYQQLKLVEEFQCPTLQFNIGDVDLFNGFKAVCAVENVVTFHYLIEGKLILKSKKITSISTHQWCNELENRCYRGSDQLYNFQIYYVPHVFSPLLKQNEPVKFMVYDKYVVMKIRCTTIYVPLR